MIADEQAREDRGKLCTVYDPAYDLPVFGFFEMWDAPMPSTFDRIKDDERQYGCHRRSRHPRVRILKVVDVVLALDRIWRLVSVQTENGPIPFVVSPPAVIRGDAVCEGARLAEVRAEM